MTYSESVWRRFYKYQPSHLPEAECWPWLSSLDARGYGQLSDKATVRKAHRLAYEAARGPVPDGLMVCHHCDNKRCVNPRHLFVGTCKDNVADMIAKGRNSPPPLVRGSANGKAMVSNDQALYIRQSKRPGIELAREFGVAQSTISAIRNGQNWKWL